MKWSTVALGLTGLAVLMLPGQQGQVAQRLQTLGLRARPLLKKPTIKGFSSYLSAGFIAIICSAIMGLKAGLLIGGLAVLGFLRFPALREFTNRRHHAQRELDLPGTLDLFAVCLRSGLTVQTTAALLAGEHTNSLASELGLVASFLDLGASPEDAWSDFRHDPVLGPIASAAIRAGNSGSRLAESFEWLAAQRRGEFTWQVETTVRKIGVWSMLPLGLCFLPAFVCLGVLPIMVDITHAATNGFPIG